MCSNKAWDTCFGAASDSGHSRGQNWEATACLWPQGPSPSSHVTFSNHPIKSHSPSTCPLSLLKALVTPYHRPYLVYLFVVCLPTRTWLHEDRFPSPSASEAQLTHAVARV